MLADGNSLICLLLSASAPADIYLLSFSAYLHHISFVRLKFRADRISIPAQQKARYVTSNAMTTVQTINDRQKMNRQANASAKSKELQPHPQADPNCSTFNFTQPHPSPPTTRLLITYVDIFCPFIFCPYI